MAIFSLSWFINASYTMLLVTFSLHTGRITPQLKQALITSIYVYLQLLSSDSKINQTFLLLACHHIDAEYPRLHNMMHLCTAGSAKSAVPKLRPSNSQLGGIQYGILMAILAIYSGNLNMQKRLSLTVLKT